MSFRAAFVAAGLISSGTVLFATGASAQQACGEAICDPGLTCQGDQFCIPAGCAQDSDCPEHMSCVGDTRRQCPDDLERGCLEGEGDEECAVRSRQLLDDSCTSTEVFSCRAPWDLACTADTDCGADGVRCVATRCEASVEECSTDSDCPQRWQCLRLLAGPCREDTGPGEECTDPLAEFITRCLPPNLPVGIPEAADDTSNEQGATPTNSVPTEAADDLATEAQGENSRSEGEPESATSDKGCSVALAQNKKSRAPLGAIVLLWGLSALGFRRGERRKRPRPLLR